MSLVNVALSVIGDRETITHQDLINQVCEASGASYESVRGSLIKSKGGLMNHGFSYQTGILTRCHDAAAGVVVDYQQPIKTENWQRVKSFLPSKISELVTLGGRYGHCIEVFEPEQVISYDYSEHVCEELESRWNGITTIMGDIFQHNTPTHVLNLDLIGYMCGSLFQNLRRTTEVGHEYIVVTIQGQVGGFRNSGVWKDWAVKQYKRYKDRNLRALKDAMTGYRLLDNHFYSRTPTSRKMRTTVWEVQ